ncbi:PAB-dependent poly(A)-specific ribonuclease subunit 3 [Rhizina undulata]
MTERPSTASGTRAFNQSASPLRPNTSGPGLTVAGVPPSGSVTPPPVENRRSVGVSSSPRPKSKESNNTFCRNITIYGYCRYQDKGCHFNHDPHLQQKQPTAVSANNTGRGKFNVDSPTFTPATPTKTMISPKAADAAPFTPKSNAGTTPLIGPNFNDATNSYSLPPPADPQHAYQQSLQHGFDSMSLGENTPAASTINPYDYGNVNSQVNPYAQGAVDMFYQQPQTFTQPLNYHLYAPVAPYPQKLTPYQKNIHGFFLSDNLREELQRKGEATLQTLPNVSSILPPTVNEYHSLVPLDMSNQKNTQIFGYPSWVYKAFSTEDGNTYALRRVEGFRLTNEADIRIIQRWKKVISANIVTIHNAWTTTKFGDSSIVFVYDYHPLSKTLAETHFGPNPRYTAPRHGQIGPIVPEQVLWSYIVQIASAIKIIHGSGLAARMIGPSKILLTSKMRIRLNCCGMLDVLHPDTTRSLQEYQQDDLIQLGGLMLSIACNTTAAIQHFQKSLEYVGRHYSPQFKENICYLCTGTTKNIDDYLKSIANYAFQNFDSALHYEDTLESKLSRELENGRLVRLLCKLGFINERPEYDHDPQWGETGDRYFLKLFRDFVFHSVDESNNPVVDMAHVLTCLNKLDAGVDEKIMLVSRDNLNCFVVTYKELKRQVEASFQDLIKNTRQ